MMIQAKRFIKTIIANNNNHFYAAALAA